MYAIADTDRLVSDGIITPAQAETIRSRARAAMVALGINSVLFSGIVAATLGLIFWLADPVTISVFGLLALIAGLAILRMGKAFLSMFGNAAALIGAGLLIGGAVAELLLRHADIAAPTMALGGAGIALGSIAARRAGGPSVRFVSGAVLLMGLALHISGLAMLLEENQVSGVLSSLFYLYAALSIAGAGWLIDVRLVSALAIVPFAQVLDTGTFYFHAAYVFYSPEPTLSILQMGLLAGFLVWAAGRRPERTARHARTLAVLAFVVANLSALVGSLWGDTIGDTIWGPGTRPLDAQTWEEFSALRDAFATHTLTISAGLFSILWALALAAMIAWAAHHNQRGLFNASLTFAAIHAYTQAFESFSDVPLAYVIGGLAAIPLAWGFWRLDGWLAGRSGPVEPRPDAPD